jgi:asparagine synthase (glutamine-hydrolysing)
MCGIAGILNWREPADCAAEATAMTARLARRGPDGHGVHAEPGLALGHRRLSIIDLSPRGAQPMTNEDGTVWLTFNGEIYNYRELRARLETAGHRFRSDADSEVLVHLYEEAAAEPTRMLDPVRGMFAFGIWDRRRRRLLLARDRLGIKPLLYHAGDGWLAFASDLDALTAHPGVPRRLDWTSLYEYLLLLTVPGPHTIFRDVAYLPPGCLLLAEGGGTCLHRYWRLDPAAGGPAPRTAAEADEALEDALREVIRLHLIADVEVGAFLSGGVDSGLVTALAAEQTGHPLHTFTAAFPGEGVDEGTWAREAAERLGARHREFALTGGLLDDLGQAVAAMDQPLALTSALSLFQLSRLARAEIKVVLSGDGGDELFGGYSRHRPYGVPGRIGRWLPERSHRLVGCVGRAAIPVWATKRSRLLERVRAASSALARTDWQLYLPRLYVLDPAAALALLPEEVRAEVETERYAQTVRKLFEECAGCDQLTRKLYVDLQSSLADEMLSKVDRMTMAWGLEARVPLLDHRFVELGIRLGGALKRRGAVGKLPLRRLVGRRLGREVADREKHGFNSPLSVWLARDRATREAFASGWADVEKCGAFSPTALRAAGLSLDSEAVGAAARTLFSQLVFGIWAAQRGVTAS